MSNDKESSVEATQKKGIQWTWLTWCMPVVAIAIAAWFVYRAIPQVSETIVLKVDKAPGINASNAFVMHRGVQIGRVTEVRLPEDLGPVELSIDLDEGRENFAKEGARYWIVRPELANASIQGLSTIVSGPEIHAEAGSGDTKTDFNALQNNPLPNTGSNDLSLTLRSLAKSNLSRGSKVVYRGMQVGVVLEVELAEKSNAISNTISIYEEHKNLVRANSVFWNSGGVNVDFGLFSGADVDISSLSSLLSGEISFATPDEPGELVESNKTYNLADEAEDDWQQWSPILEDSL